MRIAARLVLFSWLMVFGGCAEDEHADCGCAFHGEHGHDHDHDHAHDHVHDGDADPALAAKLADAPIVNTRCPLNPDPALGEFTAIHGGQKIGFCCEECIPVFEKLPSAKKTELVKAASD